MPLKLRQQAAMRHPIVAAPLALVFMPLLSPPTSRRALKHARAIQVEAFAHDDGLWDIDARITDIKTRDTIVRARVRPTRPNPVNQSSMFIQLVSEGKLT